MNSEIVMYQNEDGLTKIQVDKHCRMEEIITMTEEERIFAGKLFDARTRELRDIATEKLMWLRIMFINSFLELCDRQIIYKIRN